MRSIRSFAVALLIAVTVAPLLGGCHTTAGAGEDLSSAGHVITRDANKSTP